MAVMIPNEREREEFNGSGGELRLYELLQQLPDEYHVFHSLRWNERRSNGRGRGRRLQWGEADFVVFHPAYGVIVFEVKDGRIACTRERGMMQQNRATGEWHPIFPMEQAEKSKYYFRDLIQEQCGGRLLYPLCSAVWFTSVDGTQTEGALPPEYREGLVLWNNDMADRNSAEKGILGVFRASCVEKQTPDREAARRLLDILAPEFRCFPSIRSQAMEAEALFHRMTQEQAYLLDYLEEQEFAAIQGMAGTGKTVLAVQKARRLSEEDQVLFLCFNRFLKEHLSRAYPNPRIRYDNLPGLCPALTRRPLPKDAQERDDAILDLLLDWENVPWQFKHIIVDEGQDFNNDHLQALREIAERTGGCFYVFYDRNQFVQGTSYPAWLERMECRLILKRNCRNTREIALTSTRPIGIAEEKIKMRREPAACDTLPKPVLFFAEDGERLKAYLIKLLGKYVRGGVPREEIVVLSCKGEGGSLLDAPDGGQVIRLDSNYSLSRDRRNKSFLFTTVRKFKGLEAKVIICVDIDGGTFANERERNAFYVGTSRATTYLDLVSSAPPEELSAVLTDGKYVRGPRCRAAIRDSLRVKLGTEEDLSEQRIT